MNTQQQIEAIDRYFPEFEIQRHCRIGKDVFSWHFRCINSIDEFDEVFDSPVEALAHFTQTQVEVVDAALCPESDDEEVSTKTVVPVRLAQHGDDMLMSRSQAKRLLARVDRFKTVLFDFTGVEQSGRRLRMKCFESLQNSIQK